MTLDKLPTRIAITAGEPAGIGIDLCVLLAKQQHKFAHTQLVVVADPVVLQQRADSLGIDLKIIEFQQKNHQLANNNELLVYPVFTNQPVIAGKLDINNSGYVIDCLTIATQKCQQGIFSALVTAPVNKKILQDAGFDFPGHTEFLAKLTKTKNVVMMFTNNKTKLALITRHIPLANVAAAINAKDLELSLQLLHINLQQQYGIKEPKIAVCGLNPHAGEGGYLGNEEITTIIPVIQKLTAKIQLYGPLSADTAFTKKWLDKVDLVVAMYHDQGLAAFKAISFGESVNVTLGLPIIRTSVDHGTALDLAGSNEINQCSFLAAIKEAIYLVANAKE